MIDAVTRTLIEHLKTALPLPDVFAHSLHDQPTGNQRTVGVVLYEVGEDPAARNRPPVRTQDGDQWAVALPPMGLLLRYLITAWSNPTGGGPGEGLLQQQQLLAGVATAFHETPRFSGPDLQPPLDRTDQVVRVVMQPLPLEERVRVWQAVNRPYQLALFYEVRVLNLPVGVKATVPPVRERLVRSGLVEATG